MIILAIFLDTSFLIAYYNEKDQNHSKASNIAGRIENGDYGYVYASDYVLDEFFTYMQKKHRNPDFCYELADGWINRNEGIAEILEVGYDLFYNSLQLFMTQNKERKPLSVNDCTIVKICEVNKIQYLVTFDDGFDGYLELVT